MNFIKYCELFKEFLGSRNKESIEKVESLCEKMDEVWETLTGEEQEWINKASEDDILLEVYAHNT